MTIKSSGPLSLSEIQAEFGGSAPTSLSEYYAGGAYVPNPAPTSPYQSAPIPTSGPIKISMFYGVAKVVAPTTFVFNDYVPSTLTSGYNLASRATAAGWNGVMPLIATIRVGDPIPANVTYITAPWPSVAFTIPSLPTGSTIEMVNYGVITGAGGAGGYGASASPSGPGTPGGGSAGATGMNVNWPMTISNYGTIAGGGGGGGGGGAAVATGTWEAASAGGGGGGGAYGGAAGSGASASGPRAANGTSGSGGSQVTGGVGGQPGSTTEASSTQGKTGYNNYCAGGQGGKGGDLGQPGFVGYFALAVVESTGVQSNGAAPGGPGSAWIGGSNLRWKNSYGQILGINDGYGTWVGTGLDNSSLMGGNRTSVTATLLVNSAWPDQSETWYGNGPLNVNTTNDTYYNVNWPQGYFNYYSIYGNDTGSPITVRLYGKVDDYLTAVYVNGISQTYNNQLHYDSGSYYTSYFTLPTGACVIQLQTRNTSSGQGSAYGFKVRLENQGGITLIPYNGWKNTTGYTS